MLARGYVVTATDYPGLGTPEVHPYLVGRSEARAVLDSVRAAKKIPEAGAGDRFAVWGHSQGGQAALFTGLEAARYAPELKIVGVAAAAPATDLAALMSEDLGTGGGNNITAMTLWSWGADGERCHARGRTHHRPPGQSLYRAVVRRPHAREPHPSAQAELPQGRQSRGA
jgi:acetyl esterase/lipase